MIGFLAMLMLFIVLVYCPEEKERYSYKNEPIKEAVCLNRKYIVMIAATAFFAYVANKVISTWKGRQKKKKAMMNAVKNKKKSLI